jgi:hypothetical protein
LLVFSWEWSKVKGLVRFLFLVKLEEFVSWLVFFKKTIVTAPYNGYVSKLFVSVGDCFLKRNDNSSKGDSLDKILPRHNADGSPTLAIVTSTQSIYAKQD